MDVTKYADAGLHGWKAKVGERAAAGISKRTPLRRDQVKLAIGAIAFFLSLRYVVKTIAAAARRR